MTIKKDEEMIMQEIKEMDRLMVEIKEIFKYITKEMHEKLPTKLITLVNDYKSETYEFKYDIGKELIDQEISEDTKNFIAYLHYNYWTDEDGKKRIEKAWDENQTIIDEKYSYDNLFKKNKKQVYEQNEETKENTELTVFKEPWYKKIFKKIKSLFTFKKG